VIGQYITPEMQFRQCCLEIQDMEYKLALANLQREKAELKIAKLERSGDPIKLTKAKIERLGLEQHELAVLGAERELATLRQIFAIMPHFSRQEIDAAQQEEFPQVMLQMQQKKQLAQSIKGELTP